MNAIIWGGAAIPVDFEVHRTSGPDWWDAWKVGARKRPGKVPGGLPPIRTILLHHTAAENPPKQVISTLHSRKLGIHFIIYRGLVWQCADPVKTVTFHGGYTNDFSIGIEMCSAGLAPPVPRFPRTVYRDRVKGKNRDYLDWKPYEVDAADRLCRALAMLGGLDLNLPLVEGSSSVLRLDEGPIAVKRTVLRELLPASQVKQGVWGVLGHLHVAPKKPDPSPRILDELATRWASR